MDTVQDCAPQLMQDVAQLTQEVAQLRDLFLRRLMEDKQRGKLYDAVVEQNAALTKLLEERSNETFVRELLLVCDRIEAANSDSDFVRSILDELLEVLSRRGVTRIDELATFNPRLHSIVGTVPVTDGWSGDRILGVRRNGYTIQGRLLRASEVIVAVKTEGTEQG